MPDLDPPQFSPEEAARADDPLINRVLVGKFRLERLLGVGAMGRVYQAEHLSLSKKIAVKVLHRHLMGDDGLARRFHREAKSAFTLNHPNSIRIMDFGQDVDGVLYIAMELLDGESLHDVLSREAPLPLDRCVHIMSQVCHALDEAHHHNIVHRDLKPENVMVMSRRSETDFVKVCDFGIAKVQDPKADDPDSTITMAGMVCGTPEYMSPEQARGELLDGRSDLYSLGVILYHMVTDRLPFTAESALGCVTKHLTEEPPPPRQVRPDLNIPPILEEFILRVLAKARDVRPPTAAAFAEELEEIARKVRDGVTLASTTATDDADLSVPRADRKPVWILLSLAVVIGVGVGVYFLVRGPGAKRSRHPAPHATAPITNGASPLRDAAVGNAMDGAVAVTDAVAGAKRIDASSAARDPMRRRRRPGMQAAQRPMTRRPMEPVAMERPRASGFAEAYAKATAAFSAGQCPTAIKAYREALTHRPGHARSLKGIAGCYARMGRPCRALRYYRRLLRVSPSNFVAKNAVLKLGPKCGGK